MNITLSNLALAHLVEEMQLLTNGFVNKSQTLDNGWTKLKIHTKTLGDKNLILTSNAFFISNTSIPAKLHPGGFSALLKKYLMNQRIISLSQHGADRIVLFEFPEVFLVIELFAKGNQILCDKEMLIIKAERKEEWKDRTLAQGELYKFPSSKGPNPKDESLSEFEKKLSESEKSFFGAAVDALNTSPAILEYIFDALALDKKKGAKSASSGEVKKLLFKIKEIYAAKPIKPFVFDGALYSTEINKPKEKEFADINSALNALLLNEENKIEVVEDNTKQKKQSKFLKEMTAKQAQIGGLTIQEQQAQSKGEAIYLHYNEIKELLEVVNKAKSKGLAEKEIIEKINAVKPIIKELDFKKKKLVVKFD
ncbi:MAG: NFACT family protein [archaeon]